MGVIYSGSIFSGNITGTVTATFITDVKAALESVGWTSTSDGAGGWYFVSVATPGAGIQVEVRLVTSGGGKPRFTVNSVDRDWVGTATTDFVITAGRTYKIIANPYQFFIYAIGRIIGESSTANYFSVGCPYIPTVIQPYTITAATNASPIVLTLSEATDLVTGEEVYVQNALGNTAANGLFFATVVDSTHIELDGSTGNGAYTSGGKLGTPRRISRLFWAGSNANDVDDWGWRANPCVCQGGGMATTVINQHAWEVVNGSVGRTPMMPLFGGADVNFTGVTANQGSRWYGGRFVVQDPLIKMSRSTIDTNPQFLVGQMYDAVVINQDFTLDMTATFDGHDWVLFGQGNGPSSLWIATS